jgi:hypothetical protein
MAREYTEGKLEYRTILGAMRRTRLELIDIKMHHAFPYWVKPPGYIQDLPADDAALERYVAWCEILVAMTEAYGATVGDSGQQHILVENDIGHRACAEVKWHSVSAHEHAQWLLKWSRYAKAEMVDLSEYILYLLQYDYKSLEDLARPWVVDGILMLGSIKINLPVLKDRLNQRYPDRTTRPAYTEMLTRVAGSGWSAGGDPELDAVVVGYAGPNPLTGSLFQIMVERGHRAYHEIGRMQKEYDTWGQTGGPTTSQTFTKRRLEAKATDGAALRMYLEFLDTQMHHEFPFWAKPPGDIQRMTDEEAAVERYVAWCGIWVAMAESRVSGVCAGDSGRNALWFAVYARANEEVTQHSVAAKEYSRRMMQWVRHTEDEMRDLKINIEYLMDLRYPSLKGMERPHLIGDPEALERIKRSLVDLQTKPGQSYPDRLAGVGRSALGRSGGPTDIDASMVGHDGPGPLTGSLFQVLRIRGYHAYREIGTMQEVWKRKREHARTADDDGLPPARRTKTRNPFGSRRSDDEEEDADAEEEDADAEEEEDGKMAD